MYMKNEELININSFTSSVIDCVYASWFPFSMRVWCVGSVGGDEKPSNRFINIFIRDRLRTRYKYWWWYGRRGMMDYYFCVLPSLVFLSPSSLVKSSSKWFNLLRDTTFFPCGNFNDALCVEISCKNIEFIKL